MKSLAGQISDLNGLGEDKRLSVWEKNFIRNIFQVTRGGMLTRYLSSNQVFHINRLHFLLIAEEVKKMPQDVVKTNVGMGGGKWRKSEGSRAGTPTSDRNSPGGVFWMDESHLCPNCKGHEEKVQFCLACEGTGQAFTREVQE